MQRVGRSWVFHRITTRVRDIQAQTQQTPWAHQRRCMSSLNRKLPKIRRSDPGYEISELLLDLDAEDNKHVRQYDEEIDGIPEDDDAKKQRDQAPVKARAAQFEEEYLEDDENYKSFYRDRFSPWRISDLDILSVVLRGHPGPESVDTQNKRMRSFHRTEDEAELDVIRSVCVWNGIPQRALISFQRTLPYMMRRQHITRRRSSPLNDMYNSRHFLVGAEATYEDNKSVLRNLLETHDGSQFVSAYSEKVGTMCRQKARSGTARDSREALAFLNDVVTNLITKGLEVNSWTIDTGLLLAIQCFSLPAARKYLDLSIAEGNIFISSGGKPQENPHYERSLVRGLRRLLWSITGDRQSKTGSVPSEFTGYRVGVYSLFTGRDVCGHRVKNSFDGVAGRLNSKLYSWPYLHMLGELGALRTMWHEFSGRARGFSYSTRLQRSEVDIDMPLSADMFASAFMRLLKNAESGRLSVSDMDLKKVTGDYENDCTLDVSSIIQSSRNVYSTDSTLSGSQINPLDDQEFDASLQADENARWMPNPVLRGKILEAFKLSSMQQSMSAFEEILKNETAEAVPADLEATRQENSVVQ